MTILLGFVLTSCAMKRHPRSGYAGSQLQKMAVASDSPRTSGLFANFQGDPVSVSDSDELSRLETQLQHEQEIKQYYYYKPLLKNDTQRIEFLNRDSIDARNRYAKSILFPMEKRDFTPQELDMIAKRDISIGMSQQAVEESWGHPVDRMPAGSSIRGNELWIYKKLKPTSNGYVTEYRHVYFEAGHVAGWETKK